MTEVSKAFVSGGFSEDRDFLWGLANELSNGPHRIFDDVEIRTWAEINDNYLKFANEVADRAFIGHSAAMLHLEGVRAAMAISLSGIEPTPLWKSVYGAVRVAWNHELGNDGNVKKTGLMNGIEEVARHPSSFQIPFRIRNFSTVRMMSERGAEAFPEGRYYLPSLDDEFGFGNDRTINAARNNGMVADYVGRWHCFSLLHPRATSEILKSLIESAN